MIENNEALNSIFQLTDPNQIAQVFTEQMSSIINHLAPERRVQLTKKSKNFMSRELEEEIKLADAVLTQATKSLDQDEFRLAKNLQNRVQEKMKKEEAEILK